MEERFDFAPIVKRVQLGKCYQDLKLEAVALAETVRNCSESPSSGLACHLDA